MKRIMFLLSLTLSLCCMTTAATAQASTADYHSGKNKLSMVVGEEKSLEIYNSEGSRVYRNYQVVDSDKIQVNGIYYSVSKKGIVKVGGAGHITALQEGEVTITATYRINSMDEAVREYVFNYDITVVSPTVTITFDSRGGSAVSPVKVQYNNEIWDVLPIPTKSGYTFKGWYYDVFYDEYSHCLTNSTVLTSDIKAYAVWETASNPSQYIENKSDTDLTDLLKEAKADLKGVVTDGMTDFDKVKAIHDQIIKTMLFNVHDNDFYNMDSRKYDFQYLDADGQKYLEDRPTSQGYAKAFWVYMTALGIDCKYISNDKHEWNMVKVDGEWYHVDVTWDDLSMYVDVYDGGSTQYKYFLRSTADLKANDINNRHTFDESMYPACTATVYDNYDDNNYDETTDEELYTSYDGSDVTISSTASEAQIQANIIEMEDYLKRCMPSLFDITYKEFKNLYGVKYNEFKGQYGMTFPEYIRANGRTSSIVSERRVYEWIYGLTQRISGGQGSDWGMDNCISEYVMSNWVNGEWVETSLSVRYIPVTVRECIDNDTGELVDAMAKYKAYTRNN